MSNELEEQFFHTFGIEPKNKCIDGALQPCDEQCNECGYYELRYPQITDRILLELIKILSKNFIFKMFNNFDDDWALMLNTMDKDEQKWFVSCNGFKKALLSLLINVCNCSDVDDIKHQVRTLFEEV